jgi:hypothetical protein
MLNGGNVGIDIADSELVLNLGGMCQASVIISEEGTEGHILNLKY